MVDLLTDLRIFSLVSLFLQSVLYGIYIITSGSCARALTRVNGRWRSKRELQWPFLLAGLFLFVNTTCSLFIQLYKCLELLVHGGFGESGASYHSSIIAVRYIPRWYYEFILRKPPISLPKFSASRLWETSYSSTEPSLSIGGTGRLLRHPSSYGSPI